MVRLQAEAIDPAGLLDATRADGDGATAVFLGTVRNRNRERTVLYLEYQAYAEMAEAEMARIERDAREQFDLTEVALVHRTGRLEIGEIAVAVIVTSAHRAPALEACRHIIDSIKKSVPIWKKEVFEGGEVWIEGAGESSAGSQA